VIEASAAAFQAAKKGNKKESVNSLSKLKGVRYFKLNC